MNQDRGQASLLTIALIGLTSIVAVATAQIGAVIHDAARAQTAADAAALAGAATGDDAEIHTAVHRNGGEVAAIRRSGLAVTVIVRIGRVERAAQATMLLVPY